MRDTLIQLLYESVKDRVSLFEFFYSMRDWKVEEIILDGVRVCILAHKGTEFHLVSFGLRSFTRSQIHQYVLDPIIAKHGYATTKTPRSDVRQQRFNERFGFVRTGEDSDFIYYRFK